MKIDGNDLEKKALDLLRKGERSEFFKCQDEFLAQVKASGEDYCSCTTACKYHGHCVDCVLIHRGHEDHLPACFHDLLNRRLSDVCRLSETRPAKPEKPK